MPCFHPLWGKPPPETGDDAGAAMILVHAPPTSVENVKWRQTNGFMPIPCGKCSGCRNDQRLQWTIRCTHEASQHDNTTFLTLTVDDDHMPWHGSLSKKLLAGFFKRLRHEATRIHNPRYSNSRSNALTNNQPTFIRFFGCGEYGTTTKRAHYHALLFGLWPQDARIYGADTFTSESLSLLWKEGTHQFSKANPDRIAYVCGYVNKKMGTMRDRSAYGVVDPDTGEYHERIPEFAVMSRRPGIGTQWFTKYETDLRRAQLHYDGRYVSIPRFYERKYQEQHPEEVEYRRDLRARLREQRNPVEHTKKRLREREAVAKGRDKAFQPQRIKEL